MKKINNLFEIFYNKIDWDGDSKIDIDFAINNILNPLKNIVNKLKFKTDKSKYLKAIDNEIDKCKSNVGSEEDIIILFIDIAQNVKKSMGIEGFDA